MSDPDEALIEAIAEAIRSHRVEVWMAPSAIFGWHCLTCQQERDPFTRSVEVAEQDAISHSARAAYAAMVEHLGLVEETRPFLRDMLAREPHPREKRRLVSRWVEVDHG
jgi:hypothetical protein